MEKRKSIEWEQKTLTSELTQGQELAKQLMNHLHPSASQETRDFLISKILFSYEKALSLLKREVGSDGESNHVPNTMLESPTAFGNSSPTSEISEQDCNKNVFKKRKTMPRWTEEVKVCSGTGLDGSLADGYSWRKYGQKDILGATYPRCYYRCTHRGTQNCFATKQVQKADADPSTMVVTYRGEHTCSQVLQSALSLAKQALTGNQNATREAEKQKPSQEMSFSFGAGLRVKTEDMDTREDGIFPSFSFPSTPIEPEDVGDHIFCATLMENDLMDGNSPTFAFEPDYLQAVSPCRMSSFGHGHDYVQTSESGLSEIISTPTSATNSPIGDFGFSLADLDFHHFENPESFAYEL